MEGEGKTCREEATGREIEETSERCRDRERERERER
jgi:hypothetical protein